MKQLYRVQYSPLGEHSFWVITNLDAKNLKTGLSVLKMESVISGCSLQPEDYIKFLKTTYIQNEFELVEFNTISIN